MKMVLVIIGCYLLGSIPFGYIVGKLFKKVDIREFGSGNIGATNAFRILGPWLASLVLLGDIGKGFLSIYLIRFLNIDNLLDTLLLVYEMEKERQMKEVAEDRKNQVGSGDRSEKIRTYNFPQDRITDHRIKKSWSNISSILDGNLDPIILALEEKQEKLFEQN